ncbi:response regulator transcription factor [Nitrincola tapanii]|uniref:Response regulator transcription factor n=1 Tax=Nitrincola tapanii TaxID=1708751 RepID=A0A5A9VYH3_9GAMM|nr:response regulator transcription factor [Nitrincola tapanii]KAA0873580.1 response regulator transcription factor [Nitrincola tapanii]
MPHLAIIEDDMDQAKLLAYWLKPYGFDATLFISAELFLHSLHQGQEFDLLLLDWILPGQSGIELLQALSAHPNLPPIIFTTVKDKEIDLVTALHLGADDFIHKPLSKTVLIARIKAVLRRYGRQFLDVDPSETLVLSDKELTLTFHHQSLKLTATEYRLLHLFLQTSNSLLSREELADSLWGDEEKALDGRALDLLISRLRKKLRGLNPPPGQIISRYGQGYLFERG